MLWFSPLAKAPRAQRNPLKTMKSKLCVAHLLSFIVSQYSSSCLQKRLCMCKLLGACAWRLIISGWAALAQNSAPRWIQMVHLHTNTIGSQHNWCMRLTVSEGIFTCANRLALGHVWLAIIIVPYLLFASVVADSPVRCALSSILQNAL